MFMVAVTSINHDEYTSFAIPCIVLTPHKVTPYYIEQKKRSYSLNMQSSQVRSI